MIPSLALWFDASDPTTITQSSGTVSQWRDKSSNAYSVIQGTASNRPTYTTNLLNGLPGIQISATTYLYQVGSSIPNFSSSPATTVYMVAKNGSTMPNWNIINTMFFIGDGGGTNRYHLSFGYGTANGLTLLANGSYIVSPSSYVVPLNSNAIIGFSSSATSNFLFYNGSNTAYASTGALPTANNSTWFLFGDARTSINAVTDENIYEFVGFNTVLTRAQQQSVEGYLATKWGLQSSLSNGHPYKTVPLPAAPSLIYPPVYPTSAVSNPEFDPRLIPGCQLWLDAADTTTITGTTAVSAWTDKSGNGNNTTIFGTPNSTFGTINNVKAMWFNGSSGTYGLFSNTGATVSGFVVGTMNSATTGYGRMIALGNNPGNDDIGSGFCPLLLRQSGNQAFCTRRFQTDRTYSNYTYDAPFLASIIYDGTNGNLYVNGATIVQFGSTGNFGYSNYSVGCGIYSIANNTIDTWTGFVGEVILYRTALTSIQQQQVEGYLAKKWKLNSILSKQNIYAPGSYLTFVNAPRIPLLPMRRAVQANKFLPSQIAGLQLWLDAADPSTFTYSSGSNISTWIDKSPGANNLTTLSGTPTYTTDGNLKIVNFKSGDLLQSAFTFTITTSSAFFVVAKLTSTSTSYPMVLALPDNNSGDYSIRYSGSVVNYGNSDDIGNGNYFTNGAPNANASFLNLYVIIDTTTATRAASSRISISGSFNSRFFIGNVAEVLVYPGGVNSTQRSQIQGYLGWKWRLKSQFPSDHPFFLIPPVPFP
jgi:hypothetical protein